MTAAALADTREQSRLASLTPGEASIEGVYDEHLAAVKGAPERERALLDHVLELECLQRNTQRTVEFLGTSLAREKARGDRLFYAAQGSKGRHATNRDLWRRLLNMKVRLGRAIAGYQSVLTKLSTRTDERNALQLAFASVREWANDTDHDDPKSRRRGVDELKAILAEVSV